MVNPKFIGDSNKDEEPSFQESGESNQSIIHSNFSNKFAREEQDSFNFWLKQADEGDAQSQAQTGLNYKNGDGVERSYEKAYYYYKLAADQCHPSFSTKFSSH